MTELTREQLIKARDALDKYYDVRMTAFEFVETYGDLIRTLINNALDEPIYNMKYLDGLSKNMDKMATDFINRRQLNQGETK